MGLDTVELVLAVEKTFEIRLDNEMLLQCYTAGDLYAGVGGGPGDSPAGERDPCAKSGVRRPLGRRWNRWYPDRTAGGNGKNWGRRSSATYPRLRRTIFLAAEFSPDCRTVGDLVGILLRTTGPNLRGRIGNGPTARFGSGCDAYSSSSRA